MKQNGYTAYLFLAFFVSINFYLHRGDGPLHPGRPVSHALFSSNIGGSGVATLHEVSYSQRSQVPEKKKIKIRTRFKAAEGIELAPLLVTERPVVYLPTLLHTPLPQLFLATEAYADKCLRGPPIT